MRAKVERIYARNPGLGPLTIVGHSKGGLIAAYYVKKLGGWRRTRAVVTLGTPHNGTPMAYLGLPVGFFARSLWQLYPGSPFLRRLADGPWPGEVRLVSLWSRDDGAAPFPAAVLDTHGLPHLVNVEVERDPRALPHQQARLPGGAARAPRRGGGGADPARPADRDGGRARPARGGAPAGDRGWLRGRVIRGRGPRRPAARPLGLPGWRP